MKRAGRMGCFFIVLALGTLAGCGRAASTRRPSPEVALRAMVEHFVSDRQRVLVVQEHSAAELDLLGHGGENVPQGSGWTAESLQKEARETIESEFEVIRGDTIDAFIAANQEAVDLKTLVPPSRAVAYITDETREALFELGDPAYDRMRERFPGSQALVFVARMSDWLAGSGDYYLVEWRDGAWEIVGQSVHGLDLLSGARESRRVRKPVFPPSSRYMG